MTVTLAHNRTINEIHNWVKRFLPATSGNVAVIFAITLVPVTSAVGVAVDFGSASSARTAMQNALDAAVLGEVKTAGTVETTNTDKVKKNVAASLNRTEIRDVKITTQYDAAGKTLMGTATGNVATQFAG